MRLMLRGRVGCAAGTRAGEEGRKVIRHASGIGNRCSFVPSFVPSFSFLLLLADRQTYPCRIPCSACTTRWSPWAWRHGRRTSAPPPHSPSLPGASRRGSRTAQSWSAALKWEMGAHLFTRLNSYLQGCLTRYDVNGRLTQDPDSGAGPDGFVPGSRADLALVRGVVREGGVGDLEAEDAGGVVAEDGVAREPRETPIVACKLRKRDI